MEIFVFGSNLAGRHGKGAALHARQHYGAEYGVGEGRTGNAYAIPTKDADIRAMRVSRIERYVVRFLIYARAHPELTFMVPAVGCGLAGHTPAQIAPLFRDAPENCKLPREFVQEHARGDGRK